MINAEIKSNSTTEQYQRVSQTSVDLNNQFPEN